MIKILGSILILCSAVYACAYYERTEKSKLNCLTEVCDFIKHIKAKIEYFSMPLDKIYGSYENHTEITKLLSSSKLDSAKSLLDKEDYKIVDSFFSSLGKGLKSEQLALCSYTTTQIEEIIKKKSTDLPNKIKVFRAIALFCGACAVILLI
ncbi:MAG: hypothetical protein J6A54_02080 [Clostridia bacterium]|nr:hypothetical protein [Clostridia bacterium]